MIDKTSYSVKEVSVLLGVSVKTVYGWMYFGDLKREKVGGRVRIAQAGRGCQTSSEQGSSLRSSMLDALTVMQLTENAAQILYAVSKHILVLLPH